MRGEDQAYNHELTGVVLLSRLLCELSRFTES